MMMFKKIIIFFIVIIIPATLMDNIKNNIYCASNIDISKSTIYTNPANPMEGLMYAEEGEPFVSPDFVSIVYTKDKLS